MTAKFKIGQYVIRTSTGQKMKVVDYAYSLMISVSPLYGEKREKVFKGRVICSFVPQNSNILETRIELNQDELEPYQS